AGGWRAWTFRCWQVARSCPFSDLLAEDSRRAEHQDHDQDDEDDRTGPARLAHRLREDLDEGDREAADRGSCEVADPAEDRGGERLESGVEAEVEADEAEILALEDAGRAGQGATDQERHRDREGHVADPP